MNTNLFSENQQTYDFTKLSPIEINWSEIESIRECTCFHSKQWNNYVHRCGYKSFVVQIQVNHQTYGYFIGTIVGHIIKMICAPLDSLGYTQGIILKEHVEERERVRIYQELVNWIFANHYAQYVSIDDWQLREERTDFVNQFTWRNELFDEFKLKYSVRPVLYLPMEKSIDELWAGLHYKSAKYSINKARKLGLYARVIDKKEDIESFLKIHCDQIYDVCKRHNAGKPKLGQSYPRLLKACEEMFPNRVLMIQVLGKDDDGIEQVMSSATFFVGEEETIYSTAASYQRYQKFCPNELMLWEGVCVLKERGVRALNFGGCGSYKLKFGSVYAYVPRLVFSQYAIIDKMRNYAKMIYGKYWRKIFS